MIEVGVVTKCTICQGIVAPTENNKSNNNISERACLGTHASMVVLSRNYRLVSYPGKLAESQPFRTEYEAWDKVPIVGTVIQYDGPCSGETCTLVLDESICVLAMKYGFTPRLIARESSLAAYDLTKVQSKKSAMNHYSVRFLDEDLRAPLRMSGVFSYFTSKKTFFSALSNHGNKMLCFTTVSATPHGTNFSEYE